MENSIWYIVLYCLLFGGFAYKLIRFCIKL